MQIIPNPIFLQHTQLISYDMLHELCIRLDDFICDWAANQPPGHEASLKVQFHGNCPSKEFLFDFFKRQIERESSDRRSGSHLWK